LARWRHTYVEGLFPYAFESEYFRLHNYNTLNLSETWLRRGDSAEALRDLYGVLLHTSATHASAEVLDSTARWDFGCTPHNWFSGKLIRFIRDLLVYEDGSDGRLHLLGGVSPAWMQPGQEIRLQDAPTDFGRFGLDACFEEAAMHLELVLEPQPHFQGFVLHLPDFLQDVRLKAQGQVQALSTHSWALGPELRQLHVSWKAAPLPQISYDHVVAAYLTDYARRAEQLKTNSVPSDCNTSAPPLGPVSTPPQSPCDARHF